MGGSRDGARRKEAVVTGVAPLAAGWLGKLPSTGDFASRRLDPVQVESLDRWLSSLMLALKEREPDRWLDAYLASPSWRFLWMPQAMASPWRGRAWIGVVIPSVDRVGRYFPLALIQPLDALPRTAAEIESAWRWLQRVDEAAADALDGDWTIEALEEELFRIGVPASASPENIDVGGDLVNLGASVQTLSLAGHASPGALFAFEARKLWAQGRNDRCYWYCDTEHFQPTLLSSSGRPDGSLAQALFGAGAGNITPDEDLDLTVPARLGPFSSEPLATPSPVAASEPVFEQPIATGSPDAPASPPLPSASPTPSLQGAATTPAPTPTEVPCVGHRATDPRP
ncbi:hypothetical protein BH11PSE8_BH11PSE8_34110 [soil metagenome]